MKKLEATFYNIGMVITSLEAVIFVMLVTITCMTFFSHTLFIQVFPESMSLWEKRLATWLMALAWEFTVLITTCNTRHINRHIPLVMAVASGVIVLFFIQAFDPFQSPLMITQRWFVGILMATINYIYAELFYAKWKERMELQQMPIKLVQSESTLVELQSTLDDVQSRLDETQRTLMQRERSLKELEAFRKGVEAELTCEHCQVVQKSYGVLRAHKGHCKQNPINKEKLLNDAA
ncbi:MAG TPA: hypothetical protein VIM65_01265 [Cyclobacteriaceae bacterium]